MTWNVTAETLCNLCSDPIGSRMDAGHRLAWWSDGKGNAYHIPCRDSMQIAELEHERDEARALLRAFADEASDVVDGRTIVSRGLANRIRQTVAAFLGDDED